MHAEKLGIPIMFRPAFNKDPAVPLIHSFRLVRAGRGEWSSKDQETLQVPVITRYPQAVPGGSRWPVCDLNPAQAFPRDRPTVFGTNAVIQPQPQFLLGMKHIRPK